MVPRLLGGSRLDYSSHHMPVLTPHEAIIQDLSYPSVPPGSSSGTSVPLQALLYLLSHGCVISDGAHLQAYGSFQEWGGPIGVLIIRALLFRVHVRAPNFGSSYIESSAAC